MSKTAQEYIRHLEDRISRLEKSAVLSPQEQSEKMNKLLKDKADIEAMRNHLKKLQKVQEEMLMTRYNTSPELDLIFDQLSGISKIRNSVISGMDRYEKDNKLDALRLRKANKNVSYDTGYTGVEDRMFVEALKSKIGNRAKFKGHYTQESPAQPNRDSMISVNVHFEYIPADSPFNVVKILALRMLKNRTTGTATYQSAAGKNLPKSSRDWSVSRDMNQMINKANNWLDKTNARPPR